MFVVFFFPVAGFNLFSCAVYMYLSRAHVWVLFYFGENSCLIYGPVHENMVIRFAAHAFAFLPPNPDSASLL